MQARVHVNKANRSRELGHRYAEPLHLRDAIAVLCDALGKLDDGVVVYLIDPA